jgi:hypothetical protein
VTLQQIPLCGIRDDNDHATAPRMRALATVQSEKDTFPCS